MSVRRKSPLPMPLSSGRGPADRSLSLRISPIGEPRISKNSVVHDFTDRTGIGIAITAPSSISIERLSMDKKFGAAMHSDKEARSFGTRLAPGSTAVALVVDPESAVAVRNAITAASGTLTEA